MGKLLTFKRPSDGFEELSELLREFYAEERECRWLEEATRRVREIPRLRVARSWGLAPVVS